MLQTPQYFLKNKSPAGFSLLRCVRRLRLKRSIDCHNIKADPSLPTVRKDVSPYAFPDHCFLVVVDKLFGIAERSASAILHLDKDQHVVPGCNDVDLRTLEAIVAGKYDKAFLDQESSCQIFGGRPGLNGGGFH
jgi:hypothetical protein